MIVFLILFALVFMIAIIEQILSATWVRWYFKLGIPIFRRTTHLGPAISLPIAGNYLEGVIPSSNYIRLLVREVEKDKLAVREKVFDFPRWGYTPVMRCLVTIDPVRREVTALGLLNAYPVAFSLLILSIVPAVMLTGGGPMIFVPLLFIIFLFVIFYSVYSTQAKRFGDICDALAGVKQGGT